MNRRHRVARTWRTKGVPQIHKKCSCGLVVSANSRATATAMIQAHQALMAALLNDSIVLIKDELAKV